MTGFRGLGDSLTDLLGSSPTDVSVFNSDAGVISSSPDAFPSVPINWNPLLQGAFASTEKILQQVTVPSGQIQITGPGGQSEVIQTNANTAGFMVPGFSNFGQAFSGIGSWIWLLILGGGILFIADAAGHH